MAEQFASISLASTPLLEVQTRSLTPPFWDLSPDEASPSQIASEGPPVASLLLDATQTDVEVVQPKAEDDQDDKEQAETTTTFQTENRESANENIVPSTPPGPLATANPMELPKLTVETPTKPHEVSDIRVAEGASGHMHSQGAKDPTPTPRPVAGIHVAMIEEEKPAPYELDKEDSASVHQGSVETKDSSESSSDQEEEEERILLYPAKPWGSSYKKRYTPSARLITRLIEKHHADSDVADARPARTRRQRRRKVAPAARDIPTSSYIPTSDASAETSADTDPPQLSWKRSLSRLKPKPVSVSEARKAPAIRRRGGPPGMSSKTGRSNRSGNEGWEEDREWDSKSSIEESDDSTYEEIALRVHGHIRLPNTTVMWHSSHIINVINPTLVATHKRKLYQLNGALDRLQMANNGFTAVEIEKFSKGFPSDWQKVLKNWASQRSQDNLSTADEEQLAPQPPPPRQPLPNARKRLVKAALIKDNDQPMTRSLRSSGKAPEPSEEEEESASEEEEDSAFGEQELAPEEPSTRTLRSSRKAPESKQEESSPEEPLTRTRRASKKAPGPSPEEESVPEERLTRTRRSSKQIALEPSASDYEPALEAESISEDDHSAAASSLTPQSLKRSRAPKGFYKAVDYTEQDDASGRERSIPSPSDFSVGHMESKKRRRRNTDADEFVPPNKDHTEQTHVGVHHKTKNLPEAEGVDSNRILRGLSVDSVEVLPTRLRSETKTATTPSPTSPKAPASSRSLRSRSTVLPASPSLPRSRSRRVSGSKAATTPRRLVLEAVVIPVGNRSKAAEKRRLEPEIKEEEEDDDDEEGLELVDGPLTPLSALMWHPSLSTFKNFRPVSMSPSLYTRSQNVVEQLKRQTDGDRVEDTEEAMEEATEEGQEESHQGEGMDDVAAETDMAMERNG
ncbi:hypothetical protein BG005_008125 [Podila minutissima]|nr:hypothetical protein BG005_008125 [Podila minutissima]